MSVISSPPGWDGSEWKVIYKAVWDETQRTKIAQKILPMYGPLGLGEFTTVSSDTISKNNKNGKGFRIIESDTTPLVEISVMFTLTKTQLQDEKKNGTAVTLATRAANLISQVQDQLVFQGSVVFDESTVEFESKDNNGSGLLGDNKKDVRTVVSVQPITKDGQNVRYGENTFSAITRGISLLQKQGHYGPYALVLHFEQYADTFAPLKDTLIMPADRIKPLIDKGFYGTGAVPEKKGVLLSLGGNTMDLTVGVDTTAEYRSAEITGYQFRVYERFALRLKDNTAVIRLEFQ